MSSRLSLIGFSVISFIIGLIASCGFSGDDDDDIDATDDDTINDTTDDDSSIDDSTDDDTVEEHPCEGQWDVVIEGDYADDFDWVTTWTSKYTIGSDGITDGIVIPDAEGWETYEAIGVRTAPGAGWSEGFFPTPEDIASYCDATTVQIRVEYTVEDGLFQGQATYHCPDALGPYALSGTVTCGTP
jgi:hypothetical protein